MEYLYEFRLLSNQVKPSDMSEKDRYMCFVQGLLPRTRAEIFMRNISDLEGAIEKATIIENARTMEKDEKSKVNIHDINILSLTSGGLRGKGEKRNRNEKLEKARHAKNKEDTDTECVQNNDEDDEETQSNKERREAYMRHIKCWHCNKYGHYRVDCGQRLRDERIHKVNQVEIEDREDSDKESAYCDECIEVNSIQFLTVDQNDEQVSAETNKAKTLEGPYSLESHEHIDLAHDISWFSNDKDPINIVEKICVQQQSSPPTYSIVSSKVYDDNCLKYVMRLTVGDKTITSIKAYKTQILAKQAAAKNSLSHVEMVELGWDFHLTQ